MTILNNNEIWQKINRGVFVIAEAGKNFIETADERPVREYLENAKKLIDAAARIGADAIKFQTHQVEDEQLNISVTSPHFRGSDRYNWVKRNTEATPFDEFWKPLRQHADERGIIFLSTAMSRKAARLLKKLDVPLWKVGSGDILDFVLLDELRRSDKPIILSSGMSTLEEVDRAISYIREKNLRVSLLHCVSKYPCPPDELHLRTIDFYRSRFDIPIGFSDHSLGIESALAAVALGATVIEKHFSFSRDLWGSDHKVSLVLEEFQLLVSEIRALENSSDKKKKVLESSIAESGMGKTAKVLQEDEAVFRPIFRKSLMAGQDLSEGTVITPDMVYAMRPQAYAGGLNSEEYTRVLGKKLSRPLKKFDPITEEVLT